MDHVTIIGASGAFLILVAFLLNQTHKWKDTYFIYDFTNLVGSGLLVAYAILLNSIPFLILNGVWAMVSLRDVITDINRNRKKKTESFPCKWLH
jgi:hypothetical protein